MRIRNLPLLLCAGFAAIALLSAPARSSGAPFFGSPQDPVEEKPAQEGKKPLPEIDNKEAGEVLKAYRSLYKKKASLGKRLEGVKSISRYRNDKLATELLKVVQRDPNPIVRAEAAKALARQDGKKGQAGVEICLKALDDRDDQVVLLALFDALIEERIYNPKWFETFKKLFPKDSTPAAVQQRIIKFFSIGKEKRAFRLLVDNLGEPVPANVDDASNPPASYWEMRWKKWSVWRLDVGKTLKELTGVEFKEAKYYKKWARKEGKALGFKY